MPFSYIVRLDEIEPVGRQLVLFTLVLVWAGDMLAYFVGKSLGRVPMAPALSPQKTWEGALGNVLASMIVAVLFARWMQTDVITLLVIAGVANIAGQAGDLIESAYKRGAAVKDSGGLLPGHGGMLDRIDSLILATPSSLDPLPMASPLPIMISVSHARALLAAPQLATMLAYDADSPPLLSLFLNLPLNFLVNLWRPVPFHRAAAAIASDFLCASAVNASSRRVLYF